MSLKSQIEEILKIKQTQYQYFVAHNTNIEPSTKFADYVLKFQEYIENIKNGMKTAIINKGVNVPENVYIENYPSFINEIVVGTKGGFVTDKTHFDIMNVDTVENKIIDDIPDDYFLNVNLTETNGVCSGFNNNSYLLGNEIQEMDSDNSSIFLTITTSDDVTTRQALISSIDSINNFIVGINAGKLFMTNYIASTRFDLMTVEGCTIEPNKTYMITMDCISDVASIILTENDVEIGYLDQTISNQILTIIGKPCSCRASNTTVNISAFLGSIDKNHSGII